MPRYPSFLFSSLSLSLFPLLFFFSSLVWKNFLFFLPSSFFFTISLLWTQYFGLLMWRTGSHEKTLMLERLKAGGEGMTEYEMFGWHCRFNGHEFEKSPGDCKGQGNLACWGPWGHKESGMTEWLNWIYPHY